MPDGDGLESSSRLCAVRCMWVPVDMSHHVRP
jgi:hypothetical protein